MRAGCACTPTAIYKHCSWLISQVCHFLMIEHMLILLYLQCCLNFVLLIVIKYNKLSQNTQKNTVPPVIPYILLWHHWYIELNCEKFRHRKITFSSIMQYNQGSIWLCPNSLFVLKYTIHCCHCLLKHYHLHNSCGEERCCEQGKKFDSQPLRMMLMPVRCCCWVFVWMNEWDCKTLIKYNAMKCRPFTLNKPFLCVEKCL